jgi:hypothetical protein
MLLKCVLFKKMIPDLFLLEERRCVGGKNPHPFSTVLQQEIRESPGSIRKFYIAPSQHLSVRTHMIYRLGVGFYFGSTREEEGW